METVEGRIRDRIVQFVENNPGCTVASVQSEVRSEFKVGVAQIVRAMVAEGVIKFRGNQVYMVED